MDDITAGKLETTFKHIGLLNQDWDTPSGLISLGIMEHDHIVTLGSTFPHEVVDLSGGTKYLRSGISGAELINATHWLGALAHSTHVYGSGVWENGAEKPNVRVTLSSKIAAEDCARLNLGFLEPTKVNVDKWKDRETEGILYVPKAGETLYRLKA